jgi:hypothetical protein
MLYVNIFDIGKDQLFFYQLLVPARFNVGKYIGKKTIDDAWIIYDFSSEITQTVPVAQRENAIVDLLKKKQIRAYVRNGKFGPKPAAKRGLNTS